MDSESELVTSPENAPADLPPEGSTTEDSVSPERTTKRKNFLLTVAPCDFGRQTVQKRTKLALNMIHGSLQYFGTLVLGAWFLTLLHERTLDD